VQLSYCVVNTNGREALLSCLESIAATHPRELEAEILVLDNASDDGSAEAAREWIARAAGIGADARLIEAERRTGKAANDSRLLAEARGELCLLLNEDTELRPGAAAALVEALRADSRAAVAGALLLDPSGSPQPCAWRLPGLGTSIASALFLHRLLVTESGGELTRQVGWVQSAAMLVRRRAAEQIGFLDPGFFVYSDETDFCKRLHDAGWSTLHVPAATAVHHEQLATDVEASRRRIVEFHRGRDRYMRKHHSAAVSAVARVLSSWTYLPRALAALVVPGHDPARYLAHARAALRPSRGQGLKEAAEAYNLSSSRATAS
jgi:N-acetylglucosaminyl-diphospho-decaprenol L-rhamnosyltransferase